MLDVSMREFLERIFDERDRQYDLRFRAGELAVTTALAAQEKAVTTALTAQKESIVSAFLSSEKAIVKAEVAQSNHNLLSNEYRSQLTEQARNFMPRTEVLSMAAAMNEKIDAMRVVFDKNHEALLKEVSGLRESRSSTEGARSTGRETWSYIIAAVSIGIALASVVVHIARTGS